MKYLFKEFQEEDILRNHLKMGDVNPLGQRIDVTNKYLERDGQPWICVMGEMHFSRYSKQKWLEELLKMKAGGITVVATYLFWIYHEEEEGVFDFSEDLDIRQFILNCQEAGLDILIRIGPWAHGECRNGGFPDWLLKKNFKLRDNNSEYMKQVRKWYSKIYEEVQGLFYYEGGNIIGIQFENELTDQPDHLLALKNLALEIGYRAPLYTVTGWNRLLGAKIPVEDVLPVFGGYPEAPWENTIQQLPLSSHYIFEATRNDCAIGVDLIGKTEEDGWRMPYEKYPFATCELGGGMQVTHHRRPFIQAMDIYALSLVKLGSGNNLPGYYMYHGGTNKIGKFSTFNESKESGYPNDYAILSYDFQAPISEYGEIRDQYRLLNLLHLFIQDFGHILAPLQMVESLEKVKPENLKSLRYAMRTDGKSGFVFINHYQRLAKLASVLDVEIDTGSVIFPKIDVKGDSAFFFPFNMQIESEVLEYATAQPMCKHGNTYFFLEIKGISPKYKFKGRKEIMGEVGFSSKFSVNNIHVVTLTMEQGLYTRKIDEVLVIGNGCDLYKSNHTMNNVNGGSYSYEIWNGNEFEQIKVEKAYENARIEFIDLEHSPIEPLYPEELCIGGKRKLIWKKIKVTSNHGLVEIPFECDTAQIYGDGKLVADNYYYGVPWKVSAELLYNKECYLVLSEMKNDFYREF